MVITITVKRLIEFIVVGILIIAVGFLGYQYWRLTEVKIYNQKITQSMQNQNAVVNKFTSELAQVKSLPELEVILVKYGVRKENK